MTAGSVLAVVTARGGSREVPRKNLRPLAGRPLIAWTIDAARVAPSLSRVVVSTDSAEIAEIARECGAEVPVLRPAELARDDTPGEAPVLHMLDVLQAREGYQPAAVMLLQPTSPLRTSDDIEAAIDLFHRTDADSVVSVSAVTQHPAWMKRIGVGGQLLVAPHGGQAVLRQQLDPLYVLNGAIYLTRTELLHARGSFHGDDTRAYVMPAHRSIDIDSFWDLHLADLALRFPFADPA